MKRDNPELEAVYRTLSEKYGQTMTIPDAPGGPLHHPGGMARRAPGQADSYLQFRPAAGRHRRRRPAVLRREGCADGH